MSSPPSQQQQQHRTPAHNRVAAHHAADDLYAHPLVTPSVGRRASLTTAETATRGATIADLLDEIASDSTLDIMFIEYCSSKLCVDNWTCYKEVIKSIGVIDSLGELDVEEQEEALRLEVLRAMLSIVLHHVTKPSPITGMRSKTRQELLRCCEAVDSSGSNPDGYAQLRATLLAVQHQLGASLYGTASDFVVKFSKHIDARREADRAAQGLSGKQVRQIMSKVDIERVLTRTGII